MNLLQIHLFDANDVSCSASFKTMTSMESFVFYLFVSFVIQQKRIISWRWLDTFCAGNKEIKVFSSIDNSKIGFNPWAKLSWGKRFIDPYTPWEIACWIKKNYHSMKIASLLCEAVKLLGKTLRKLKKLDKIFVSTWKIFCWSDTSTITKQGLI